MLRLLQARPDHGYRHGGGWASRLGACIDLIRLNAVSAGETAGLRFWTKRRTSGAPCVAAGANLFFRAVRNPVQVIADPSAWRAWEVSCFAGLHGAEHPAFVRDGAVWTAALPGEDLALLANTGTLSGAALAAAGRELRRTHAWVYPQFRGLWSHGDPHLGNFIYDHSAGRARLIDFETTHSADVPDEERHADDLKVVLLDLLGRSPADLWPDRARAFLNGYGPGPARARLPQRFSMPSGSECVWWAIRTSYLPHDALRRRVQQLQDVLS